MKQRLLFALLIIHRTNFQMLHWKVCGSDFDNAHNNVTNNYYEKVTADIDDVAEMLMRQGMNPLGYYDVVKLLADSDVKKIIVDNDEDYSKKEAFQICDVILEQICEAIIGCLEDLEEENQPNINAGVKSYYENLLDQYDKEYRFLNKRRIKNLD